jgi:hypothetical protein
MRDSVHMSLRQTHFAAVCNQTELRAVATQYLDFWTDVVRHNARKNIHKGINKQVRVAREDYLHLVNRAAKLRTARRRQHAIG